MKKPEIRLIALDMDGTLSLPDNTVSKRNMRALQAAAERGVAIAACSGRTMAALPPQLLDADWFRYGIAANGACVVDRRKGLLHREMLTTETALELIRAGEALGAVAEPAVNGELYINEADAELERECVMDCYRDTIALYRSAVPDVRELVRAGSGVEKLLFFCPTDEIWRELVELIPARYNVSAYISAPKTLEVMKTGVSKGSGLKKLAELLNIPPEQVMVCGDERNDLPMFTLGCFNVAMGNAVAPIRELADYVTGSCFEDGVAAAVEKFVLG